MFDLRLLAWICFVQRQDDKKRRGLLGFFRMVLYVLQDDSDRLSVFDTVWKTERSPTNFRSSEFNSIFHTLYER